MRFDPDRQRGFAVIRFPGTARPRCLPMGVPQESALPLRGSRCLRWGGGQRTERHRGRVSVAVAVAVDRDAKEQSPLHAALRSRWR